MKTSGMGTVGIFPNSLLYPTQTRQVSTAPRSIPETTMVAVEGQAGDDQGNVSLYSRLEGWLLLLFNNGLIFSSQLLPCHATALLRHQRQGRRRTHLWAGLHVVGSRTEETARVA